MITVEAVMTLAHPQGGEPFPANEQRQVDPSDPAVKQLLDAGYLRRVDEETGAVWAGHPDESWTKDQLRSYADQQGVSVADSATKAELLEAIEGTTRPPMG